MENRPYSFQFLVKPITYIIALISGTCLILWIEKLKPSDLAPHNGLFLKDVAISTRNFYPVRHANGKLNANEKNYGLIAWKYFEKNVDESTGFCRSISKSKTVTINDLSFYLMGLISAYEIKIIDSSLFDSKIKKVFNSLSRLELNKQELPYNTYIVNNLEPVKTSKEWSGVDIGHFYGVCNKIMLDYPEYNSFMRNATNRWRLENAIIKGSIYSG